jgi:sialate O-acetylesterase
MIAPLVPFALRGALWYQGESNVIDQPDGPIYTDKMEALIHGWRKVWGQGDFPFYYVQLAPYCYHTRRPTSRAPSPETLAEMWEYQTKALRVPHTGMAVITDLVDDLGDIHPVRKQEVGQRLARLALAGAYTRKDVVATGPMFRAARFRDGQAIVSFDGVDGGLVSQDGQSLTWFTIAGTNGVFHPAAAEISGDTVIVSNRDVPRPVAVRFAWHETAQPNLFNRAGLPAAPFRSDSPTKP